MIIKEIDSSTNPEFRRLLKLRKIRGVRKQHRTLLSGPKQVREALRDFPDRCVGILLSHRHELPPAAAGMQLPCYRLAPTLFREMDVFGTRGPILLISWDAFSVWSPTAAYNGCTLCPAFQDPANMGAVIRSAAAFGVSEIVVPKEAAHPFHPKSVRTAGTALLRVVLKTGPSVADLSRAGRRPPLVALSPDGMDLGSYAFPDAFCLIAGLEGPGLPPSLEADAHLAIPMQAGVDSLNAATATAIALYEWRRFCRHSPRL